MEDSLVLQVTASGSCNLDNLKELINGDIPGFQFIKLQEIL